MAIMFEDNFNVGNVTANGWSNEPNSYPVGRSGTGRELQFNDQGANTFRHALATDGLARTEFTFGYNHRWNATAMARFGYRGYFFTLFSNNGDDDLASTAHLLEISQDGTLGFWSGGNNWQRWETAPGVITVDTNYYIELYVLENQTAGAFEVRVNGVTVLSQVGVRVGVTNGGSKTIRYITPDSNYGQYPGQRLWIDDLYAVEGKNFRGAPATGPTPVTIAVSFLDDEGLISTPTITALPTYNLVVSFIDESRFLVPNVEVHAAPRFIAVSFADDTTLVVDQPVTHAPYPKYNIAVSFADESQLKVNPRVLPIAKGPFFFAWADEGEVFSSGPHGVIDEEVFSFEIKQDEGDFAKMQLVIRNPRVGLLSVGRQRWAFLSMKREGELVPLFYGRIIGVPNNVFQQLVTIDFIARPVDFVERKAALAETLRTLPYWDPAFINPDSWNDDDTVLEARSANWAIDRVTHEVTISDLITAEDDVMAFAPSDYNYDGLDITLGNAPLRAVQVTATMSWNLYDAGGFDLTTRIRAAFGMEGDYNLISSFTFEGLSGDWPKQGSKLGDGWTASQGSALVPVTFQNVPAAVIPYFYDASTLPTAIAVGSLLYSSRQVDGEYHWGTDGAGSNQNFQMVIVPIGYGLGTLGASYVVDRTMGQRVTFTMRTDVQDVLTLAPESDVKLVTLNSNLLSDIGYAGEIPIVDSRNRDYIRSTRGQLSLQHLVLLARANLVAATRVVKTTFSSDFFSIVPVSMRKGAFIENERVPGGFVAGKITSYTLSLDGNTGTALGVIEMASAVGKGGAYTSSPGEPIYVEDEYVDPDYQERRNEVTLLGTGDVTYTVPEWQAFDDDIDFKTLSMNQVIKQFYVTNTSGQQRAALLTIPGSDQAEVSAVLEKIPTQCHLLLAPLSGGPFIGQDELTVANLVMPKQIDLESAT